MARQPRKIDTRETSRAAYASVEPELPRLRADVLKFIRRCGKQGATCDEIEAGLGMSHQTVSARVNELMNTERIVDVGRRKTRSGRTAFVWIDARA